MSVDAEVYSELLDLLYGGALDEHQWAKFSDRIAATMGGIGGTVVLTDNRSAAPSALKMTGALADIKEDYVCNWWQHDPKPSLAMAGDASKIFSNRDYERSLTEAGVEFRRWEFRAELHEHITGVAVIDENLRLGVSVPGRSKQPVVTASNATLMIRLLPHLRRAAELGWRHSEALEDGFWKSIAMRDPSRAVLLLDRRGRILRATLGAVQILDARDGFAHKNRELNCDSVTANDHLARAIAVATADIGVASNAFRVMRPSGRLPYIVTVYPAPIHGNFITVDGARALVTITDRTKHTILDKEGVQSLFVFTAREAELALLLHAGHSVETAAFTMQTSLPTARVHLRRVLAKTGCSKQSELLSLMTQLAAV